VLAPFTYLRARSLEEVTALLAEHGRRARILAGGTDLLVGMRSGEHSPEVVVDIKAVPELRRLGAENGTLSVGAAVTINGVLESPDVAERFPILIEAGRSMASHQVRNRATLAGNLCNASPAADMATPLLVLGARLRVGGPQGERTVPVDEFFVGCKENALGDGEWMISVLIDTPPPGTGMGFLKQGRVRGPDLSIVNCAAVLSPDGIPTLAVGAVAEVPVKISGLDSLDAAGSIGAGIDRVTARVREAIRPIDDVRGSAEYRTDLAVLMAGQLLERLADGRGAR